MRIKSLLSAAIVLMGFVASTQAGVTFTSDGVNVTCTFDLGASGSGTRIEVGTGGLLTWVGKGTLPIGSILQSVSVNATIEAADYDSWASDISAYFDPVPTAPGTAAGCLQVGGYSAIGSAGQVGWSNGQSGPVSTVIDTKTAGVDFAAGMDLHAYQLSIGNDYGPATWSGSITVKYALPGTVTWTGASSTAPTLWSDAANWNPAGVPGGMGQSLEFGAAGSTGAVELDSNRTAGRIRFLANAPTTISGAGVLTLDNIGLAAILEVNGAAAHTIGRNVTLVNGLAVTVSDVGGSLNLSGALGGNGGLTKDGPGLLRLSNSNPLAPNTYVGGTTLKAGTLQIATNESLGSGNLTFQGGTLQYPLGTGSVSSIDVSGKIAAVASSQTVKIDTNNNEVTFGTAIGGAGGLGKLGAGTLRLDAANGYTGKTDIYEGILALGVAGSLSATAAITIGSSGTLDVSAQNAAPFAIPANVTLTNNWRVLGNVSAPATTTLTGAGSFLRGSGVGPYGVMVGGTIRPGNGGGTMTIGAVGSEVNLSLLDNSIYQWGVNADGTCGLIQVNGNVSFGAGVTVVPLSLGGSPNPSTAYTIMSWTGTDSGSIPVLSLPIPNTSATYNWTVTSGDWENGYNWDHTGFSSGEINKVGQTLQITNFAATATAPGVTSDVIIAPTGGAAVTAPSVGATVNSLVLGNGLDATSLSISAPATVNVAATATLNHNSTLTGQGTLAAASLNVPAAHTATISGGATALVNGATVSGVLNLNNGILKAAAASDDFITGGGTVAIKSGGATINTNGNAVTLKQAMTTGVAGANDGGLIKAGDGVLTVGAAQTYTGATAITAGTLRLGGATLPFVNGLQYHLDASNPASLIASDGVVTSWNDLTPNHRNFTTDRTAPTVVANAFGALPGVHFNGIDQRLHYSGDAPTAKTVFIVNSTATDLGISGIWGLNNGDNGIRLNGTTWRGTPSGGGDGNDYTNGPGGNTYITTATSLDQNTGNFGSFNTPYILTAYGSSNYADTGLGDYFYGGRWWQGNMGEVLVFDTQLSTADRVAVETYLQSKWLTGGGSGAGSLPSSTTVTMSSGTTFDLNGAYQQIASLSDAVPGATSGHRVLLGGGMLKVGDATSTIFSGAISGNGWLTKVGAGTLTLKGINTQTGGTAINEGILAVGSDSALGASLKLAGGTFQPTAAISTAIPLIVDTAGGTVDTGSSNHTAFTGSISGTGPLTKIGDGTLSLIGTSTLSSPTNVVGGKLVTNTAGLTGPVVLSNNTNVTFDQPSDGTYKRAVSGNGSLTKAGAGTLTLVAKQTYAGPTAINAGTVKLTGTVANLGLTGSVFLGCPQNDTRMNLDGSNYWASADRVFAGDKANTVLAVPSTWNITNYTGAIEGFGMFAPNNPYQDNAITTFSGTFVPSSSGDYRFRWSIDDRGLMYMDMNGDGIFQPTDRVGSYAWDSSATKSLTADTPYNFIFMAQNYGGGYNNNLYVTAPGGPEVLVNPSGSNQGGMWATMSVGAGVDVLPITTAVTMAAGTTLDLSGVSQQIASLADDLGGGTNRNVINSSATLPITLTLSSNGAPTAFSGVIGDGGGVISLIKDGTATQTLSGANTYTGSTTINGGMLQIAAGGSIDATSGITVNSAGTLDVSALSTPFTLGGGKQITLGGGTVKGNLVVNGILAGNGSMIGSAPGQSVTINGTISPGTNNGTAATDGIGTFTVGESGQKMGLSLGATSIYNWGLGTTASGLINVNGAVTVADGATVRLNYGVQAPTGDYTILTWDPAAPTPNKPQLAFAAPPAGTTVNWTGGASTQNWADGPNWDLAKFSGGNIDIVGSSFVLKALTVSYNVPVSTSMVTIGPMSGVAVNGPSIDTTIQSLDLGRIDGASASSLTIMPGVALGVTGTTTVHTGAGLTVHGTLTTASLTTSGTVNVSNTGALGTLAAPVGTVTINGGATTFANGAIVNVSTMSVNSGTLSVAAGDQLGAGGVTVGSGTLQLTGSTYNSSKPVTMNGGTIDVPEIATISGPIGGSAPLTKSGAGALIVTGNNTFSSAIVEAGTLQGSVASIKTNVALNVSSANVVFNQAGAGTAATYDKVVSGGGNLAKIGDGTLAISKPQTYLGATTISGGTLQIAKPDAYPTAGLLGKWTFDDGTANDSSGNGYNGTAMNGPAFSSSTDTHGGKGSALVLNGANQYVKVDTSAFDGGKQTTFNGGNAMTISAWVKGWPSGGWNPFISKNGEPNGWQMRRHGDASTLDWTARGLDSNGGSDFPSNTTVVANGNWHMVTMTYDGTARKIYVDGVLDATRNNTETIAASDSSMMLFGARDNGGIGNYFNGSLDDIYFYNRALTATEVDSAFKDTGTAVNNNLLPTGTSVAMASGTTLDLNGNNQQIGSLADVPGATGHQVLLGSGTLTVGNAASSAFSGAISGAGGITKVGSGTLTLSGVNSHSGATAINEGKLVIGQGGSMGTATSVSVASGATYGLNQTVSGPVSAGGSLAMAEGATIDMQDAAFNTMAFNTSGTAAGGLAGVDLKLDLGASLTQYDKLTFGGSSTFTGKVNFSFNTFGSLENGTYFIVSAPSGLAGECTPYLLGDSVRYGHNLSLELNAERTAIVLNISGAVVETGAYWAPVAGGGGSGSWTAASTTWATGPGVLGTLPQSTTSPLVFAGAAGAVTIGSGGVSAAGLTFDTASYTIAGDPLTLTAPATVAANQDATINAVIAGSAGLAKSGAGTLLLTAANIYTGTTAISGGTLQVGNGGSGATLGSGMVLLSNNAKLAFNHADAIAISQLIGGTGSVTKSGTGTLTLTGSNYYTGTTTITAGTIVLGVDAQYPVLGGAGVDLQHGKIVFDAGDATVIKDLLTASYNATEGKWLGGQFKSTTASATGLTLGWKEDIVNGNVTVMATFAGDANVDGSVDGIDLDVWKANVGSSTATFAMADLNYDGSVDGLDLDLWKATVGSSGAGGSAASAPVPEPGTLALLTMGLMGLLGWAWRRGKLA